MNSAAERGYFAARRNQSSGTGVSPVSFRFWGDDLLLKHTGETPVPLRRRLCPSLCLAEIGKNKWWHRTIQTVRNGPQQFRFARANAAIGSDGLRAGAEEKLF